jgi:hypothetical protein
MLLEAQEAAKNKNAKEAEVEAKKKAAAEEYIPVDFDAYSIVDRQTAEKRE